MLRMILRLAAMLLFVQQNPPADDDDGDDSDDANAGGEPGGNGDDQPFATFPDQASFNRRIGREARSRLAKQAEDAGFNSIEEMMDAAKAKRQADEKSKSDLDKAQQEAQKAQRERDEAIERANRRLVNAEARAVAAELGVESKRISYAVRMADLSEIDVDENGEPDAGAIKSAIEQVLTDIPELKGAASNGRSGDDFDGTNRSQTVNPWKKDSWNLTEQGRILRESPKLAEQFQREAKA